MSETIASIYPFPYRIGQGHDVNFSLLSGGDIYSYEEAKISQIMHDSTSRIPERSMLLGFRELGLAPRDVDQWVFGAPYKVDEKAALGFFFGKFKGQPYDELHLEGRIHYVTHHKAHAYLAIATSPFDDGCFFTLDGGGDEADDVDSTWGVFEDGRIVSTESSDAAYGLTLFHGYICELIGYLNFVDHGKLMGLASYAEPPEELCVELRRFLVRELGDMNFKVTLRRQSQSPLSAERIRIDRYNQYKTINQPNPPEELVELTRFFPAHEIASAGQRVFEQALCDLTTRLVERTGKTNVVFCGGAFHNVSANRRIHELEIADIFVPMGVGDEGLSLGAAFAFRAESGAPSSTTSYLTPFLGPGFSTQEVDRLVSEYGFEHRLYEDEAELCHFVARGLDEGKIVGWFQGRAELGARSLGARSVLADPRRLESKARLNQLLKRRDWFMPFAPAILEGHEEDYLEHYIPSPYMAMAFGATPKALREIPAGIHVDKTCRPNSVSESHNPRFHRLIMEFKAITGIPAVLNTSFNRHGIPTIASPRQAFEHLAAGSVDLLAIEGYVVFREMAADADAGDLLTEKVFLGIETVKPIVRAWLDKDDFGRAISMSDPEVIDGLRIWATDEEFSLLDHVFKRDGTAASDEIVSICGQLLVSNGTLVERLQFGRDRVP